jgi:hypothetical protein
VLRGGLGLEDVLDKVVRLSRVLLRLEVRHSLVVALEVEIKSRIPLSRNRLGCPLLNRGLLLVNDCSR